MVRWWYALGTLVVLSRYARGRGALVVEVRSWYALSKVLLPFGTLTFFLLILYDAPYLGSNLPGNCMCFFQKFYIRACTCTYGTYLFLLQWTELFSTIPSAGRGGSLKTPLAFSSLDGEYSGDLFFQACQSSHLYQNGNCAA